jgi:HEPN domain-containing protein
MNDQKINIEKIVNHWISRSDHDFETMLHLFESKDYHWSLFIGHLVIERLLKAAIVKVIFNHAPLSHDLRKLANLTDINFNDEHKRFLDTITTFNLNARYDDYKLGFYKKCTSAFTEKWITNIKELRSWIKKQL